MTTQFMPELSESERIQILQEQSAKVREGGYDLPLTEEEIENRKNDFYKNQLQIWDLETQKKEVAKDFKDKIDGILDKQNELTSEISTKSAKADGILYDMPNYDSGFMETYDKTGELVETRKMTPAEKKSSKNIFLGVRTGTNQ